MLELLNALYMLLGAAAFVVYISKNISIKKD